MVHEIPTFTLHNQVQMPVLGFGSCQITEQTDVFESILNAVNYNYRLIDTASVYKNETQIGNALKHSPVPRSSLFLTSKVWNTAQVLGDVEGAFWRSLERLGVDYLDLYLIHWPIKGCFTHTWKSLEKLYISGKVKSIGVSNFQIKHLQELMGTCEILPMVNQFEFHPYLYQQQLVDFCHSYGIVPQAHSPLAQGHYINDPLLIELGNKYQKTPAQIGLRWIVQNGLSVIPKASSSERIFSNSQIFDFNISADDMLLIDGLNKNLRLVEAPELI
jgi:Aldo/keto reductases, related to diketogulonate reductase